MSFHQESDGIVLIIRFIRALLLAAWAVVAFSITAAMFWRDIGISSLFDSWFGELSETQLTALAAAADLVLFAALRVTQRSEAQYRTRSSSH